MSAANHNDEIDLFQIFGMIKEFFRKILRAIFSVITFYKKKAILFLSLLLIGAAIGFFMDRYQDTKDTYTQEIIIEPKYKSTKYIYDFVESLESNFRDDSFIKKLNITPHQIKNVKEIKIEPVVQVTDILDQLKESYEDIEFFSEILELDEEKELSQEKYRVFYNQHTLTIDFTQKSILNKKVTDAILNYIKLNVYYQDRVHLSLKQNKANIEQNKRSLEFVDTYLTNLSKNPLQKENGIVVLTDDESDTPTITVASLLNQKEALIKSINKQEEVLTLNQEVISVVHYGSIISKRKELHRRMLFLIPLTLCGVISLFFFLVYLNKQMKDFVSNS